MKYQTKYIQISSGRGPAECEWVVAQLLKVILKECSRLGLVAKVLNRNKGSENGTLRSALIEIKGIALLAVLAKWSGTIQWIGQSPFRKFLKRKNWFVSVKIIDQEADQKFNDWEITFQTFKASGPGGQHRNKVETAVRAIHKPSGLIASASDSRSQHQNKQKAIRKIHSMIKEYKFKKELDLIDSQWQQHDSLERGNPIKVFIGKSFKERK